MDKLTFREEMELYDRWGGDLPCAQCPMLRRIKDSKSECDEIAFDLEEREGITIPCSQIMGEKLDRMYRELEEVDDILLEVE